MIVVLLQTHCSNLFISIQIKLKQNKLSIYCEFMKIFLEGDYTIPAPLAQPPHKTDFYYLQFKNIFIDRISIESSNGMI